MLYRDQRQPQAIQVVDEANQSGLVHRLADQGGHGEPGLVHFVGIAIQLRLQPLHCADGNDFALRHGVIPTLLECSPSRGSLPPLC